MFRSKTQRVYDDFKAWLMAMTSRRGVVRHKQFHLAMQAAAAPRVELDLTYYYLSIARIFY